jgi:methionyl aminopeptidase
MIQIKNKQAIQKMEKAGSLLAQIVEEIAPEVKEGITTLELDALIEGKMHESGLKPECKGYAGYRHATCISVNDTVVHGVPSEKNVLKTGDLVKIDVVGSYRGYCADMARCFFVGSAPSEDAQKLVATAQEALDAAIKLIKPGVYLSDLSSCIQVIVEKQNFGVVRDFAGHGIGKRLHEDPEIPNFGKPGMGPVLQAGMTLAIEPMITLKNYGVYVAKDGWTAKTTDGSLAAHVEDTILVTESGSRILTRLKS